MIVEAALFKILADPTRLMLAVLLSTREEICVCNLAQALDEPEYKISRHLGAMRSAGLVTARREGTWMHYRLVEPKNRMEECLWKSFRDCLMDHQTVKVCLNRLEQARCVDKRASNGMHGLVHDSQNCQ